MARKKQAPRVDTAAQPGSGGLGILADALAASGLRPGPDPADPAPEPPSSPSAPAPAAEPPSAVSAPSGPRLKGKVVLRFQRKGRGGKGVTRVEQLELPAADLDAFAKQLRRQLGCGVGVEGSDLVVQGEQADRLRPLLMELGAKRVVGP